MYAHVREVMAQDSLVRVTSSLVNREVYALLDGGDH